MARRPEGSLMRLGAVTLVVMALVMAAAFNLQRFPGFRGTSYHAVFDDASGLHKGNMVQIAGIRVGRVDNIRITGNHVTVDFDVHHADLGRTSEASVQVLNLLGEKYLELTPRGTGTMGGGSTIPASRTDAGYDIVGTLDELTTRTEQINTPRLAKALTTLAGTVNAAAPQVRTSFTGLARLSRTIASRDEGISQLLDRATRVTKLLADRRGDLVALMKQGDLVFKELIARRDAIHTLLVNTRKLSYQLRGLATDNQKQIAPALTQLHTTMVFLNKREKLLRETIHNLGPYASILINIIGTGPWFDAYVPNFTGMASGEFQPGAR